MTSIKLTMFINLPDGMAKEFLKGTPQQRYVDLATILERDYDIAFSEPEVYQHADNGASDGAVPASPYEGS